MVDHINNSHKKCAPVARRKLPKSSVEYIAVQAAVWVNLSHEMLKLMPISSYTLKAQWLDKFREADAKVTTEISMALAEKAEKFHVRDIPSLNATMAIVPRLQALQSCLLRLTPLRERHSTSTFST